MDLTCESAIEWKAALAKINRAVEDSGRGLTGLSTHVRVRARKGSVELLTYDDVVTATTNLSADVQRDGGCCIPLRLLHAVLDAAPDHPLSIHLLDNFTLRFGAPRWQRSIAVRSVSEMQDFPTLPSKLHSIPSQVLRRILDRTLHAADTDPDHPDRGCVILRHTAGHIEAFASDGHRASYSNTPISVSFPKTIVIHQRALRELRQVLSLERSDDVEVGESSNRLFFRAPSTSVAALLPPVAPQDFSMLFGKRYPSTCRVPRAHLVSALNSACATTGDVEVLLRLGPDGVILTADAPARGSTSDEIVGGRSGDDTEVTINAEYLRDAATALGGDMLRLEVGGPLKPLVVRPDDDDDNAEMVIMAMQPRS